MASKVVAVAVMMMAVMATGGASAVGNAPNTWWSCMADCPGYNCAALGYLPVASDAACYAYCSVLCSIPPKANTLTTAAHDSADQFCKLGCVSSKCLLGGTEAMEGCIHGCTDICSSSSINTKPAAAVTN